MADFDRHTLWNSAAERLPRPSTAPERFLSAIRSSERCDFNLTAQPALHKAVLIGTIAQRLGATLIWNDSKGRFHKNDAANALL